MGTPVIDEGSGEDEKPPMTAPPSIPMWFRGFEEGKSKSLSDILGAYVRELSRYINLENLDGITVAYDYEEALLSLDRGYETSHKLTPTKEENAIGVAMTPAVIREGKIKSHIVLNAGIMLSLENHEGEHFPLALSTLAHECAHVDVTAAFDKAFPDTLLKQKYMNAQENCRSQVIKACWDEFAASWIGEGYGSSALKTNEELFLSHLASARNEANNLIKAYRIHGDHLKVLSEVYGVYGTLMKFACYLIGTMTARDVALSDLPETQAALSEHWFLEYFEKLLAQCKTLSDNYGKWADFSEFEVIGDILDDIMGDGGFVIWSDEEKGTGFRIPYTRDTMPDF